MFNYEKSTNLELIAHMGAMKGAGASVAKIYHEGQGNSDIVKRIDLARKYIKLQKLKKQVEQMQAELDGFV